ncbi:schwannomin-interacting protein 1 isoform X2 [Channa argus]|uniref:schwannomin-interacting protein 1 isoform X2 n=1 Tax=Channa argus TaxID=215402 RepID=UPI00352009A7
MEGEKETAEEKEEEEEEEQEEQHHCHIAAASSVVNQDLPLMHWEDLSQRIAELEKQEQERRERSKRGTGLRTEEEEGVWRDVWKEEEEDFRRCRVAVVTSRFHNHRNLQLCFINNSDSEDEEDVSNKKVTGTGHNGCHAAGLKQEVATALRTLRDKLLAEQKEEEDKKSTAAMVLKHTEGLHSCTTCIDGHNNKHNSHKKLAGSRGVSKRKHLEHWELRDCSMQQLSSLRASLQQEVHTLSSELVAHLLVRDQLRTKQDAMLLDVQDLT